MKKYTLILVMALFALCLLAGVAMRYGLADVLICTGFLGGFITLCAWAEYMFHDEEE